MLDSLRKEYDYIILDTPPVEPLIDPRIVSCLVDKTVMIVKWGSTDREAARNSIRKLDSQKRIAGVVLNFVDERQVRQYARYTGYYNDKTYSKYFND